MTRHKQHEYGDFADFEGSYEKYLRFMLDNLQEAEYAELARSVQVRLADLKEQWEQDDEGIPIPAEADTPLPMPQYSVVGDKLVVRLLWPDGNMSQGFDPSTYP